MGEDWGREAFELGMKGYELASGSDYFDHGSHQDAREDRMDRATEAEWNQPGTAEPKERLS